MPYCTAKPLQNHKSLSNQTEKLAANYLVWCSRFNGTDGTIKSNGVIFSPDKTSRLCVE
jgi:hypothetical protein